MTPAHPEHNDTPASKAGRGRWADFFVVASMALVSTALAAALQQQGGIDTAAAVGAGSALFALFVATHAVVQGGLKKPAPKPKTRPRRKPAGVTPAAIEAALQDVAADRALLDEADIASQDPIAFDAAPPALPVPPDLPFEMPAAAAPEAPEARAWVEAPPAVPLPQQMTETAVPPLTNPGRVPFSAPSASAPESFAPAADPMQSYWSYAPGSPRLETPVGRVSVTPAAEAAPSASAAAPSASAAAPSERAAAMPTAAASPGQPHAPRQEDVDVIHGLIKKLADEVNAAERNEGLRADRDHAAAPLPPMAPPSIETSLDALRTTASSMRAASAAVASAPATIATSAALSVPAPVLPPIAPAAAAAAPSASGIAADIASALSAGRMDVLLEPIMGLDDQRARHYEVTLRLRSVAGSALDTGSPDVQDELKAARILPLIDAVKLQRTAGVAALLVERGKPGSVFSSYAGQSLADRGFMSDVVASMRARPQTAGQLILSFSQSDVRGFAAAEWMSLGELRSLGFRFALSDVTDLDMDFGSLARAGFSYAKLDADVFLDGLHSPAGLIPSADVCRHLAGQGLALVIDRIDSEMKRVRIFGFGVLFGQGQLFGVPRPVKTDAGKVPPRTVAA